MDVSISHDEAKRTLYCTIDGMTNSLQYERRDSDPVVIDIFRTFVHPDLRGKGIAESLLKNISEFALSNGFTIQPSCSFAVMYYRRHREYASILARDADLENGGSCRLN